jgi:hypothetical protein
MAEARWNKAGAKLFLDDRNVQAGTLYAGVAGALATVMNTALQTKLITRLKSAFSNRHLTADVLKDVLIDIRSLLELVGEAERYKTLKFHCDWILHPKLTGPRAQKIIRAIDAECVKSVAKAGLGDWPDVMGADFFGPVSSEFVNELLSHFTFQDFEVELQSFLDRHQIVTLADPRIGTYRTFEVLYCQLIEDRTWEYTNTKHPTRYVNRLCLQMLKRPANPSAPPQGRAFPYFLSWTFLWNDERRICLEVEFLSQRP